MPFEIADDNPDLGTLIGFNGVDGRTGLQIAYVIGETRPGGQLQQFFDALDMGLDDGDPTYLDVNNFSFTAQNYQQA